MRTHDQRQTRRGAVRGIAAVIGISLAVCAAAYLFAALMIALVG